MDERWMVLEWHWTISDGFWKSMSFMCFWYLPTKWLICLSIVFAYTVTKKLKFGSCVPWGFCSLPTMRLGSQAGFAMCSGYELKVTAPKAVSNYEFAVNRSVSSQRPVDEWLITSCGSARNHHVRGELAWCRSASIWAHRPIVCIKSQTHCHFKGNLLNLCPCHCGVLNFDTWNGFYMSMSHTNVLATKHPWDIMACRTPVVQAIFRWPTATSMPPNHLGANKKLAGKVDMMDSPCSQTQTRFSHQCWRVCTILKYILGDMCWIWSMELTVEDFAAWLLMFLFPLR